MSLASEEIVFHTHVRKCLVFRKAATGSPWRRQRADEKISLLFDSDDFSSLTMGEIL
jgi:hypothetical protein